MKTKLILLACVAVLGFLGVCQGLLTKNFYKNSCPSAESTVNQIISQRVLTNPSLPARLLRMHFHDCFVRGCDGSILLNSTANSIAEKDALINLNLASFDVIDEIKAALETACPRTVSCSDILALAARDAVSFQYNRNLWVVLTGRRDGTVSLASEPPLNLPTPDMNFTRLKQNFANKGLSQQDLIVLSGGHTIGIGHCFLFRSRLYNFTGNGDQDPSLDPTYATFLKTQCPNDNTDFVSSVEMDPASSTNVDTNYYSNLLQKKGLFSSDAALLTNNDARNAVIQLVKIDRFLNAFANSMERMGAIGVLTGTAGQIREKCWLVNSST
ncbi:hypothetical protein L6164_010159 [Bauhinia variegata]|uniref:Uncharacterized protein n=1 Tax=Bauhinia variegata TaxID=167791 RepID=A0ACB9PNF9_BAUVA|nr:hypothetical protein L6164_010159 [Bauhinia variegata]